MNWVRGCIWRRYPYFIWGSVSECQKVSLHTGRGLNLTYCSWTPPPQLHPLELPIPSIILSRFFPSILLHSLDSHLNLHRLSTPQISHHGWDCSRIWRRRAGHWYVLSPRLPAYFCQQSDPRIRKLRLEAAGSYSLVIVSWRLILMILRIDRVYSFWVRHTTSNSVYPWPLYHVANMFQTGASC
jgi:hypothetical protein